ncbi:MAG: PSD1 domain-containing protein [Verrucomicrobiales bacterium]|nr:PSD1 domain-containing protein [Verrucomicrobiales bacterium]
MPVPVSLRRWPETLRRLALAGLAAGAMGAVAVPRVVAATPAETRFREAVEPILQARCYECHSHQAGKTKGGLTLDSRSGWATGGEHGPALVPGQPEASLILQAVRRTHAEIAMPPKLTLPASEVAILESWVREGAQDPREDRGPASTAAGDWWAIAPLHRPEVPGPVGMHPVDAFVTAALARDGARLAPPAARRTVLRRMMIGLHGLSPTAEEADAFERDGETQAFESRLDRLLASPHYGERWARHWLDVAHFAETHGHDQDRPRESAWPYRDYLIEAFNTDRPYARFVQEQLAADALFPDETRLIPALGFLAAGPWDESSLRDIRDDTLDREIARYLDRDDMIANVMSSFAGVTVHCARCHDHKFDPIPQRDYYALQAVFAGTEKAERLYDLDPATHRARERWMRLQVALDRRETNLVEQLRDLAGLRQDQDAWEREMRQATVVWTPLKPVSWSTGQRSELSVLEDLSLVALGASPTSEVTTVTLEVPLAQLTALRLEVLPDDRLPARGPGRAENGNLHLTDLEVSLASSARPDQFERLELFEPSADFEQSGWTVAHAIDPDPATGWGVHPEEGKAHFAVFNLREPHRHPRGGLLRVVLKQEHGRQHTLGRFRFALTDHPGPVRATPLPARLVQILAKTESDRTAAERYDLTSHYLGERAAKELRALPEPRRVFAGAGLFPPNGGQKPVTQPRPVHLLRRGEITKPQETATPGALSCVPGLPSRFAAHPDGAARRADLARWLTDRDNPLLWRTVVNRVWHYHFGRGIVETPNDFGRMGSTPASRELLDWLAVTFRDDLQGSVKALHRLILTSATWRQQSADPLHAHRFQPLRRRLDAETYRDTLLALAGTLDPTMGGPSDKQFLMSAGIHVTPNVDYAGFDLNAASNRRRAIYRFLFRTLPDPLMDALDAPPGDQSAPVRSESFTALQAFALLHHPFVLRQGTAIAERVRREGGDPEVQARRLLRWVYLREPVADEVHLAVRHADRHGLDDLCRLLLNSNEFHFVD